MAEKVDDLTITYKENDLEIIKELEKVVLTKGTWATIVYKYQELDRKTNQYGAPKASIRRYQKRNGFYRQQSKFTVSSGKQAQEIANLFLKWFPAAASE